MAITIQTYASKTLFCFPLFSLPVPLPDDVEFEVSLDKRTGKPIAVKLVKIKPEVLPEERISGQVGPDLHASPITKLHGYIHPVKEHILLLVLFYVFVLSVFICMWSACVCVVGLFG